MENLRKKNYFIDREAEKILKKAMIESGGKSLERYVSIKLTELAKKGTVKL